MNTTTSSKAASWTGWILSGLVALLLGSSGINALTGAAAVAAGIAHLGYAPSFLKTLGCLELTCVLLFLIPRTALLGAILLTGYLGGAVASHARIGDPTLFAPLIVGVIVWLALVLRDQRVRNLCLAAWKKDRL